MTVTTPTSPLGDAVKVEDVLDPQVLERARRRSYTAKYKAAILAECDGLDRDGRGALMRRGGPVFLADQRVAQAARQGRIGGVWARAGAGRRPTRSSGRTPGSRPGSPGSRLSSTPFSG